MSFFWINHLKFVLIRRQKNCPLIWPQNSFIEKIHELVLLNYMGVKLPKKSTEAIKLTIMVLLLKGNVQGGRNF